MNKKAYQASNGWIIATTILCAVLLAGFIYINIPEIPEQQKIVIPTAQEVADLISIPNAPDNFYSLREALKQDALALCDDEFDMDDVEDLFDDDDEIVFDKEYEQDRVFHSIRLGIDNYDDRRIIIERKYRVEVEPDIQDDYRDKVYVKCEVTSDDGELEAELRYRL